MLLLFAATALAYPTAPNAFPAIKATSLSAEAFQVEPGSYAIIDTIRSADW